MKAAVRVARTLAVRRGRNVGQAARHTGTVLGVVLALAAGSGPALSADAVVAFTLSSMPLRTTGGAVVHVLDARDGHAEAYGADLPGDPERALAEARRRLATPAGRAALARIAAAAAGNALASRLGIEKLPAVVVDGRYVVYGVRDVARAIERVEAWRAEAAR